jgi:hypothetical protein
VFNMTDVQEMQPEAEAVEATEEVQPEAETVEAAPEAEVQA